MRNTSIHATSREAGRKRSTERAGKRYRKKRAQKSRAEKGRKSWPAGRNENCSEAWKLNADTIRIINGANSRMLHHITGKTIHEEASSDTRTFDIIAWIRARRLQWLGHILRMKPDVNGNERLLHLAVRHMHQEREQGDLIAVMTPHP